MTATTRRQDLEESARLIKEAMLKAEANELPGLSRELRQINRELEELPTAGAGPTSQGRYRAQRERRLKAVE